MTPHQNVMATPIQSTYLATMNNLNLAIIEDDPIMRKSLSSFLPKSIQINLLMVCESAEKFLETLPNASTKPDIVLLDVQLPGMNGIRAIPHIRAALPDVDIVMLTTFEEDETIFAALCAGACSYISKRTSLKQISDAIYIVSRGGSFMSPSVARKVVVHFSPKQKKPTPL